MFSVIIPTLNEEKLLPQCLEQFTLEIKQKFGIEIIVSDGGSKDKTLDIARSAECLVLRAKSDAPRQTIAEGRNLGAAKASGEIFVFLNADTIIPNIVEFFERSAKCLMLRAKWEDSTKNLARSTRHSALPAPLVALAVKVQVMPAERKLSDRIFHAFFNRYVQILNKIGIAMGRGECQIVRADAFREVGGYNESLAAGEDFEFYRRLSKIGKIRFDPKLLLYESPRRYRKYGYTKVYAQWVMNACSILFSKKAVSEEWEQVR